MDDALAYCLERFADEQIAENIEQLKEVQHQLETRRLNFKRHSTHHDDDNIGRHDQK